LNTNWYIDQLKNREPYGTPKVAISLSDATIDRIQPVRWDPRWLTIPVPPDVQQQQGVTDTAVTRTGAIRFYMPATLQYGDIHAIRVQDILVRDIVEQSRWKRPIYFAVTCSDDSKIGLQDYLIMEGLAQRLVPNRRPNDPNSEYIDARLMEKNFLQEREGHSSTYEPGFKFRGLNDPRIFYDENQARMTLNYRYAFIRLGLYYLSVAKDKAMCIKTMDKMQEILPPTIVPVDYRVEYDIANIYYSAGAMEQYKKLAPDIERAALEQLEKNPRDVSTYYNPYRILSDLYEKNGQYGKAADLMNRLSVYYPGRPEIQNQIQHYRALADSTKKDSLPG
jgi:tetratricopeptide (TPR) repeat protein